MAAIQTMKRSDTQKRTGGLDFLKSRRFKMGARICLLYDGFFSFAVVRQLANRLFLFMRIIIKSKCYTNVRGAFDFDKKQAELLQSSDISKIF